MKYIYNGPASGVTLADGSEILLWPGAEVDLPEQHEYTQTLVALNHLTPVVKESNRSNKDKKEVENGG